MNIKEIIYNAEKLQKIATNKAIEKVLIDYPTLHFYTNPMFEYSGDGINVVLTEDTIYNPKEISYFFTIDDLTKEIEDAVNLSSKDKMLVYLNRRIEAQSEIYEKANNNELSIKISAGAKLTAYKEVLEYVKTQIDTDIKVDQKIETYKIDTSSGICDEPLSLPFLNQDEFKKFNDIGYSGKLNGVKISQNEYLNSLNKGSFNMQCIRSNYDDFSATFIITRVL